MRRKQSQHDFMQWQIGHLLRRAYARARKNSANALARIAELSPVQASALAALRDEPLSQAELGRLIDMEPANTYTLVQRLIRADLVTKVSVGQDRRQKLIALSPTGEVLAERLEGALAASSRETMSSLSPDEQHQLVALLRKLDGLSA